MASTRRARSLGSALVALAILLAAAPIHAAASEEEIRDLREENERMREQLERQEERLEAIEDASGVEIEEPPGAEEEEATPAGSAGDSLLQAVIAGVPIRLTGFLKGDNIGNQ